jgi:hypothetical protein
MESRSRLRHKCHGFIPQFTGRSADLRQRCRVQRDLRKALELLDNDPMPVELKTAVLGLELVNLVGAPVLDQAVKSLRDRIT